MALAESISSRIRQLNQLILGTTQSNDMRCSVINRDGLIDALCALYEECNNDELKKNALISNFVQKMESVISFIYSMRVSITDFEVKTVIGRGNFGEVQVVREKASGYIFAMKTLRKAETLAHHCVAFYEEEKDIMAKSTSPWITKLEYAFQDAMNLYLVMEFHPGGDMLTLMKKNNVLTEDVACFYLAELVLAIHSVHEMGYAHRDIKPDNILIDVTGHIKLADFGSASRLNHENKVTSKMPAGTPEYIAPEVLDSVNKTSLNLYGPECDYWSLGIIAYEMLYGVTPFANEKLIVVYNKIFNFKTTLSFPNDVEASDEYIDLIRKLINDASRRTGYEKLLEHPVFLEINWHGIRESTPPYIPFVSSLDDTSNFDDFDEDITPSIAEFQYRKGFSGKHLPFIGFTYTTPLKLKTEWSVSLNNSLDSPNYSSCQELSSVQDMAVSNLHKTVAELNDRNQKIITDNEKWKKLLKAKEDSYHQNLNRAEAEVLRLRSQLKGIKKISKLERDHRLFIEKKAIAVIRCINELHRPNSGLTTLLSTTDQDCTALPEQLDNAILEMRTSIEESEYETCEERISPCPHEQVKENMNEDDCVFESKLNEAKQKISELEKIQQKKVDLSSVVTDLEFERNDLKNKPLANTTTENYAPPNEKRQVENDLIEELRNQLNTERQLIVELQSELNKEKERCTQLEKNSKKDGSLDEIKLDLRIALREKKQAEETVTYLRETNKELRSKSSDLEKNLSTSKEDIINMKQEILSLHEEVSAKDKELAQKTTVFQAHKEINDQYSKKRKQHEEAEKQNELLKSKLVHDDVEKNKLFAEVDTLQRNMNVKNRECENQKQIITNLKEQCLKLEGDLDKFQFLVDNDLDAAYIRIQSLNDQLIKKDQELKSLHLHSDDESKTKKDLELRIAQLENELISIVAFRDAERNSLYKEKNNQNEIIMELQACNDHLENEMLKLQELNTELEERKNLIEEELVLIKEEAARHITQISSLKTSNQQLSHILKDTQNNVVEEENTIKALKSIFDDAEEKNKTDILKLQATISQQTKLIDLLQSKIVNAEKKKKGFANIFSKKDPSSSSPFQDSTKCLRLQEQLKQAQAQIIGLQNELTMRTPKIQKKEFAIPVSPRSRAMHTALMSSPCDGQGDNSPLIVSEEAAKKYSHVQGMKHRIPHRFSESLTMMATKCSACLNSIHFGRRAVKCQECSVVCHTKCASSLPDTCGLPSGFIQHFQTACESVISSLCIETDISNSEKLQPEGWMKVAVNNQQRWEKRYVRIIGSSLYLFLSPDTALSEKAVDEMDFSLTTGEMVVISAISSAELGNSVSTDVLYVLKIEYRPFTTCWPPRHMYLMANSFTEKQMWVAALEDLAKEFGTSFEASSENRLCGHTVLKFKDDLEIQCTYVYSENILLVGAKEGLFVVTMSEDHCGSLRHKIGGFSSVYQIGAMNSKEIIIVISGEERELCSIKLSDLANAIEDEMASVQVQPVGGLKSCHLFVIEKPIKDEHPHLCAATADTIVLFKLNWMNDSFTVRKVIKTKEACCCIQFTANSILVGCDKFYELDLQTLTIEEFLDRADKSLSGLFFTISHSQSFPVSIFNVAAAGQPEEYLVCFHELGVFVDRYGQRTRPDDIIWSRLPLAFAYRLPYLFILHFTSLKVIEILPQEDSSMALHAVMEVHNPQILGYTTEEDGIYITSNHNGTLKLLSVYGSSIGHISVEENHDQLSITSTALSSKGKSTDSEGNGLEFSFTNSLLDTLDDTESVSTFQSARDTM